MQLVTSLALRVTQIVRIMAALEDVFFGRDINKILMPIDLYAYYVGITLSLSKLLVISSTDH